MKQLVSIITPSYNSSRFVTETIKSVQAQTYSNWELLITDDCSKDNSVEMIEAFVQSDARIKLFSLKTNVGAANARNNSLLHIKGKYIAFLDSDDLWLPDKLERQIAFMEEHGYTFTMTNYDIIDENGVPTNKTIRVPCRLTYCQYLRNTIIGCLTVIIDREKTGDFRMPVIRSSHDMALWLLIMRRGFNVYGLNETLSTYRLVSTSNTAKKWEAAKDVWRVYRHFEKLSLPYSWYCFCGYVVHAALRRV